MNEMISRHVGGTRGNRVPRERIEGREPIPTSPYQYGKWIRNQGTHRANEFSLKVMDASTTADKIHLPARALTNIAARSSLILANRPSESDFAILDFFSDA